MLKDPGSVTMQLGDIGLGGLLLVALSSWVYFQEVSVSLESQTVPRMMVWITLPKRKTQVGNWAYDLLEKILLLDRQTQLALVKPYNGRVGCVSSGASSATMFQGKKHRFCVK